jgi:hypothetical protein
MPYTAPHWQITVLGDSWVQTETWQFGVRALVEGGANQPDDQQLLANALASATQTFFSNANVKISNNCRLTAIKCASINTDGHYSYTSPPGLYVYPTPIVGPTSGAAVVPQATIAVTTLTPQSRGRASKGRFYLPPSVMAFSTDGRLSSVAADDIETAARTWLLAINSTAQVSAVAVMSKLGSGTTNTVNAVGVGRVVDTMRSRRRSLQEGRTPLAL